MKSFLKLTLLALCFVGSKFNAVSQTAEIIFSPDKLGSDYYKYDKVTDFNLSVYGKEEIAANKLLVTDTVSKISYRIREKTDGSCGYVSVFKDYIFFTEHTKLCFNLNLKSGQEIFMEKLAIFKGSVTLFFAVIDKEREEKTYYANEINSNAQLIGQPLKLYTLTGYKGKALSSLIRISEDGNSILLVKGNKNYGLTADHSKFDCVLLNAELQEVWKKSLDFSDKTSGLIDALEIDNRGNLYVLSVTIKKREKPVLHCYFKNTNQVKEFSLGSGDKSTYGC